MGKLASTTACAWCRIRLNPFSRIRLAEGLAKISLAYKAVFIALLDGFGKLSWVGIGLIVFKI